MASEIQFDAGPQLTGATVYALLRNATGLVYDFVGLSFVTYATADYARYDLALAEQGTASGYYVGDMPAVTAGVYSVTVKEQAGGSPAEADVRIGDGEIAWDGASIPTPGAAEIADAVLGRNIAGGSDGGRTVGEALAASRNKVAFDVPAAGQFTVYDTDDTTPLWVGTYSRSATAVHALTVVDPG